VDRNSGPGSATFILSSGTIAREELDELFRSPTDINNIGSDQGGEVGEQIAGAFPIHPREDEDDEVGGNERARKSGPGADMRCREPDSTVGQSLRRAPAPGAPNTAE